MTFKKKIFQIAEQTLLTEAKSIENLIRFLDEDFAKTIDLLYKTKGRIIFTGIGKSGLIAMKIVATLNSIGTPSIFMHAADAIHGDLGIIQKKDIVICISKSGNSPEIKTIIPFIKSLYKNTMIAITANKNSYLAKNAKYTIFTPIEKEACPNNLIPTSSTTAQLAIGDTIAICLMNLKKIKIKDFAKNHPGGSIGKKIYTKVKDLLYAKPITTPENPIKDVILEISNKRQGITAVLEKKKIKGVITDGDIRRTLEKTNTIENIKAKDIMKKNPITINENALAVEALQILKKKNINQILVINSAKEYKGVIHILDFIKEGIQLK